MNKLLLFFILPLLLFAGVAYPDEDPDFISRYEQRIEALAQENNRLLASGSIDSVGKMIKNAEDVLAVSVEVKNKCEVASIKDDYFAPCNDYARIFGETSARMKLDIARYCIYYGLIDTAKKLYRNIITTYASDSFASFIEQARFGLEELK